jgi:hypothetical protein
MKGSEPYPGWQEEDEPPTERPGCPIETDSVELWPTNQYGQNGKPLGRRRDEPPIRRIGIEYGDEETTP